VVPLVEHLGEAAKIIDMIVDQSPGGIEVLRGSGAYVFDANWKLQAENGADGYHVTAVHWNYAATQGRRTADGKVDTIKAMSAGGWARKGGGSYSFKNGHMLLWTNWANPEDRPLWHKRDEWVEKFGEARADWMLSKSRNLCLYPNVYLMDQFSSQIRVLRPLGGQDRSHHLLHRPQGRSTEARARRLRQYEDFFNATGMATPDDLEEFRSCQHGFNARAVKWNDMTRGATHWVQGPDENADLIGLKPELSGIKTEDEGLYVVQHQYWLEAMKKAASPNKKSEPTDAVLRSHSIFPVPRSPCPRRTPLGRLAGLLRRGCGVLDALLGRRRHPDHRSAERSLADLLRLQPQGLEDRVFRIETERSSATIPDTRTSHSITNVEVLSQDEGSVKVRFNWTTHSFRYDLLDIYFGYLRVHPRRARPEAR
jgi:phenylpropionate dioxygenase-like ring-hydroxylating dioxygenase large terminal subunit